MKVIIKEPKKKAHYKEIDNDLESMQEIVEGYIETIPFYKKSILICNEDGKYKGLLPNILYNNDIIVGNIIICGMDYFDGNSLDTPITLEEFNEVVFPL